MSSSVDGVAIRTREQGVLDRIETEQQERLAHYERFSSSDAIVRDLVREARDNGSTWQEIGDALGVTRQAAQQRYGCG